MIRIIAFNGGMFTGKTTAIDALKAGVKRQVDTVKFAQPLYDIQNYIYQRIDKPVPQPKDRKLLQWLGTDWGRSIDPNMWVNLWKEEVGYLLECSPTSIVTCDDCRFDNEAETVKSVGGIVVRITAPVELRQARAKALGMEIVAHASEAGITDKYVDYEICNDGDEKALIEKMAALAKKLGL